MNPSERTQRSELTPTSFGLLERVRNLDDHKSWQEFFDVYWKLIHLAVRKAGLDDQETEDVVQDTMICVAREMKTFRYEPRKCSFKGWLMLLTRQRVIDCVRRRRKRSEWESGLDPEVYMAEIPDQAAELAVERTWTEEWQRNLLEAADQRVRRTVRVEHYEIYYLHCVKNMPARQVSKSLGVSIIQVYVVQHRITQMLKREVQRLKRNAG